MYQPKHLKFCKQELLTTSDRTKKDRQTSLGQDKQRTRQMTYKENGGKTNARESMHMIRRIVGKDKSLFGYVRLFMAKLITN